MNNALRYSHPLFLAETYAQNPWKRSPYKFDLGLEAIAKLLAFESYVRAQTNRSVEELVASEVEKYPYKRKSVPKVSSKGPMLNYAFMYGRP